MKYDSSMTHLNDTVMANLRRMCSRDKAIIEKYCTENATPAQLQDFLKSNCSNSGYTDISEGINFWCSKSQGVRISLGFPVNNDGDKTLTLSWSQATKFILNNWKDILGKSEPEKATEAKPTYKDVFLEHYPDFDVDRFEEFIEEACVDFYFEFDTTYHCDRKCKSHWNSECLHEWRNDIHYDDLERVKEFLVSANVSEEKTEDNAPEPLAASEIVPANAEEKPAVFDYSELDSDTAGSLRECENIIRQKTAGYFTLLGEKFKEAQRLLADHAGGTFEKWYTALGFKRQTVYNLIQRYDFLSSPVIEGRENAFEELPATLSYEISKPDAPRSLVEKVLDGDITTNAEYLRLKAELEEANKRAENAEMLSLTYKQNCDQIDKLYCKMRDDNTNLEKRIRELEKRPVDVAVEQNDDVMNELEQLREENERLRDKNVKNFLLHMTIEEFEQLLDMTESSEYIHSIVSKADIIRL